MVIGDLRVQSLGRKDGVRSHTIVCPDGTMHREADRFLRTLESGTDRTYAYLLVDHLRWLERECLAVETVSLRDLQRAVEERAHNCGGLREDDRPPARPWS